MADAPERAPRKRRRVAPELWSGPSPNGIGHQKPNHYLEMARTVWENKSQLPYAWRILSKGVCDGCALGVAGFRDWTIEGVHLCTTRLNLLQLNTMGALDPLQLRDVSSLEGQTSSELRHLGRLPYPMLRRHGERGFQRISWDDALELAADRIRALQPAQERGEDRLGIYMTG